MTELVDMAPNAFREIARKRMRDFLAGIGGWDHPSRLMAADRLAGCSKILDVGCGPGVFLETLYRTGRQPGTLAYYGADPVTEMRRPMREDLKEFCSWHYGMAAERLVFVDSEFDGVLVRHVLEHIPQPLPALIESARVCYRDLVIVFSQWPNERGRSILTDGHLKAARFSHSRAALLGALPEFEMVESHRFRPGTGELAPREELWHLSRNRVASLAALERARLKP